VCVCAFLYSISTSCSSRSTSSPTNSTPNMWISGYIWALRLIIKFVQIFRAHCTTPRHI
jgi:hypothetical protein